MSGPYSPLLLILGFCSSFAALALAHGEYAWIAQGGYRSPVSNESCCGEYDCFQVAPEKVHANSVGYWISGTGETVPYSEVLVSQDGKYWRCQRPDGSRRCFFAPSQGS